MSDLIERQIKWLRDGVSGGHALKIADSLESQADEIERLEGRHDKFLKEFWATNAENASMKAALRRIGHNICISEGADLQMQEIALAALKEST